MTDDKALARSTDPQTSHDAAKVVNVSHTELAVLIPLSRHPMGLTVSEIAEKASFPRDSISPRMRPLLAKKMIIKPGTKRIPFLTNPRQITQPAQLIWEITAAGRELVKKHELESAAAKS